MPKKSRSKIMDIAAKMPPLRHTIPGQEFDIRKSEVMQWLVNQPVVLNYIWNNVKNSEAVSYDPVTGKWQGVDYELEN